MKNFVAVPTNPNHQFVSPLVELASSPQSITFLSLLSALALLSLNTNAKKGKLATSYWGGKAEKAIARKQALLQIESPKRNSASLYIGTPDEVLLKLQSQWLLQNYSVEQIQRKAAKSTSWVPHIQRGVAVSGAAGTGKTYSAIDPMLRSSIDQGFPVILYDFKFPAQTSRCVAYALKRGYKVRFFTPGFLASDTCNILDFLKNEEDAVAAGQLATTIAKNIDLNANASSDKFFEDAGATLVEGIFLLAKAVGALKGKEYADLMTASAILSLPQLGKRLEHSRSQKQFPIWTMRPLDQLISVCNSAETESGIVGTAQRIFQKFLKKDFMGAFCGKSTLPLDLDGREMVVFGLDRNNRNIVGPLLAATLHMMVSRNISRVIPRKDPLCVFLDELPTLYLPQLWEWLTQNREDGFCGILGFQNLAQLEQVYSKEIARIIFGNCATKFLFNPQEVESAKYFADILGEFDVTYSTKSRSHNSGKSSGSSKSTSENRQKRFLWEPSQFLKMGTGRSIMISPAHQREDEEYIPIRQKIKISQADIDEMEWSKGRWPDVWEYFEQQRHNQIDDETRRSQFEERYQLVNELFPLPDKNTNKTAASGNSSQQSIHIPSPTIEELTC
jgi:type IV secretory pathway TraG/TraD family ATPase VirD4